MELFSTKLKELAKALNSPLYAVGGYVRNYILAGHISQDIDLCGAIFADDLKEKLKEFGFKVLAVYKRTGTIVFGDGKNKYEYTTFRSESYQKGGSHTPEKICFTNDIVLDANRRDFTCNAVYINVLSGEIIDPLNRGVLDIKKRVIDTTKSPKEVFKSDGLRLLRLAKFSAQLNFEIKREVLDGARQNCNNILDISAQRIYSEIIEILNSDTKYPFSNKKGHYLGLKILESINVLQLILPELCLGKNMFQRADYHKYDVLEHSLKCVYYAPKEVRLSALLHDVAKPKLKLETGKFFEHEKQGETLAKEILKRLNAPKKVIEETAFLVRYHMYDLDCKLRENKLKKFIVFNHEFFPKLLALKQADFSASKDDLSICPTVEKWQKAYQKMLLEKIPFSQKELKIKAKDLVEIGFTKNEIGNELERLFNMAIENASLNQKEILIKMAKNDFMAMEKISR